MSREEPANRRSLLLLPLVLLLLADAPVAALAFPRQAHQAFARLHVSLPDLASIGVCLRVQWNPDCSQVSTIFSYAAPVFTNEFQLRGQRDVHARVLLALIIHGQHLPYKASFANDGAWHHVCVTWRRRDGAWAIYVDGDMKDAGSGADTSRDLFGDGIFILGQDQDSFGGNFTEPFSGNIADLAVWTASLDERHVRSLNACEPLEQDVLFSWDLQHISRHPDVQELDAPLFCPGEPTFGCQEPGHVPQTINIRSRCRGPCARFMRVASGHAGPAAIPPSGRQVEADSYIQSGDEPADATKPPKTGCLFLAEVGKSLDLSVQTRTCPDNRLKKGNSK